MQPSPYRPGELADLIPGREPLLRGADERISYVCDLGRLAGRIQVYTGPRGFGKTSLLRQIQRRAEARGAVTLWVTAGETGGLTAAIAQALRRASESWRDTTKLRAAIDHATVTLNVGVASVEAGWSRSGSPAESEQGARALEQMVSEAIDTGKRHDRRGLVLLVDEVQSADLAGLRTLGYAWQHLQAERSDLPAAVFTAGLPDSPGHIVSAVSFSERFGYAELPLLTPAATVEALTEAARPEGVSWQPAALELAVGEAAGYPYAVQLIGDHAWAEAGYPDAGGVITADHARTACEATRRDVARLIETRWVKATPAEQQFMSAMAGLGDGPARRLDIASALGSSSTQVSTTRDSLLKKGLITPSSYGYLEFTVPGMARYLRERGDA